MGGASMTQSQKKKGKKSSRRNNESLHKKTVTTAEPSETQAKNSDSRKEDSKEANAKIADIKNQVNLEKKKKKAFKTETSDLDEKLTVVHQFENFISEDISTAKNGYFISLYTSQGKFSGQIMRLYKKEKPKPIKEQDKDTIVNFISKYFPQVEEQVGQPQAVASYIIEPFSPFPETGADVKMQRLCEFEISQTGITDPFNVFGHDQPFQIKIDIDLNDLDIEGITEDTHLNYKTFICCKHLSGKPSQCIAEINGETKISKMLTEIVELEPLPEGTYRLEADTIVTTSRDKTKALASFRDKHIFHVT